MEFPQPGILIRHTGLKQDPIITYMKKLIPIILLLFLSSAGPLFCQSQPVKADIKSDGFRLDANFYPSGKDSLRPAVILLQGFPGNNSSPLGLAEKLNSAGLNVLAFNYQGSFASEGEFSFDNSINNVKAAYDFLTAPGNITGYNIDTSKIVVCGYSFGGAVALESGMYWPEIRNLIAIGNADNSVSLRKTMTDPEFRKKYVDMIASGFEPSGPLRGDLKAQFAYYTEHVDRYDLVLNAGLLAGKRVFFIVGFRDNTSLMEVNTLPLYRKLVVMNPEIVTITGFETDHSFRNVRNELAESIIQWIYSLK
jgi:pimeloyl-ACP methyl ester carboxylesterase